MNKRGAGFASKIKAAKAINENVAPGASAIAFCVKTEDGQFLTPHTEDKALSFSSIREARQAAVGFGRENESDTFIIQTTEGHLAESANYPIAPHRVIETVRWTPTNLLKLIEASDYVDLNEATSEDQKDRKAILARLIPGTTVNLVDNAAKKNLGHRVFEKYDKKEKSLIFKASSPAGGGSSYASIDPQMVVLTQTENGFKMTEKISGRLLGKYEWISDINEGNEKDGESKPFYVIVDGDESGPRLCKDNKFRSHAPFGTPNWTIKVWASESLAVNKAKKLIKSARVLQVPAGASMDASGRITKRVPDGEGFENVEVLKGRIINPHSKDGVNVQTK